MTSVSAVKPHPIFQETSIYRDCKYSPKLPGFTAPDLRFVRKETDNNYELWIAQLVFPC